MKLHKQPVVKVENICDIAREAPDITSVVKPYTGLKQGTVLIRFRNYELHAGGAALLSFINNQYIASYFTIYIVLSSMVGFVKKTISKDQSDFHTVIVNANEQAQVNMINTLAVSIKEGVYYKIFLNGKLVKHIPDSSACFLSDISLAGEIEAVLVGKMLDAQKMKQRSMLFHGDIDFLHIYDEPLKDDYLIELTGQTVPDFRVRVENKAKLSAAKQLCFCGYQGADNYRIPNPMRTCKGTLLAVFDKMFQGPQDHPNRIHLVMRRSEDKGKTWKHAKTLLQLPGNAQAIDSCMVQDEKTGRIFLLSSTYPENVTVFTSDSGIGYCTENGVHKRILVNDAAQVHLVQPDGTVTLNNFPTQYTAAKNGTELYCNGAFAGYTYTEKCPLRVPLTSFLMMMYSDDDGKSWSEPVDLNPLLKKQWMHFWGCAPGTGIQLKRGEHKGRLLMQTYCFNKFSVESPLFIYSDDHGQTWCLGESINDKREYEGQVYNAETADNWSLDSSESQAVELPSGKVLLYAKNYRNPTRCVAVAESTDGGATFKPHVKHDLKLQSTYSMSVIEWPVPVNGQTAYLFASSDSRAGNYNGAVKLGFYVPDNTGGYIQWKHSRLFKPGAFGYCFMCPVTDDTLGIAYESSGALHLSFQTMNLEFLMSQNDSPLNPVKIICVNLTQRESDTVIELCFNQLVMLTNDKRAFAFCNGQWLGADYIGRSDNSMNYKFLLKNVEAKDIDKTALSEKADVVSVNGMLYNFSRLTGDLQWQYYNRQYITLKGTGAV